MRIIDLTENHQDTYFVCLEDWSEPIVRAIELKREWYGKMKDKGLRVKLAVDDSGVVGGMIHYLPIEHSVVEGRDLYFIPCMWVHGHKQGRGDFTRQGMGTALLKAAEEDIMSLGSKGIVAWGMAFPGWNEASWYTRHGYEEVDRNGPWSLVWKPLAGDAVAPRWIRGQKTPPQVAGKVTVTAFLNGWCPAYNMVYEGARRASAEFGDRVVYRTIDTFDREAVREWGISDGVFIDGESLQEGPPPSYEEIRDKIASRVRELGC
jgi:hypothetical protein